jgi:ClpP class serine protease
MQNLKSQHNFPHIRGAIYSQPWAITAQMLETICEIAEAHISGKAGQVSPRVKRGRRCPNCKSGVMRIEVTQVGGRSPKAECTCSNCGCECEEDDLPPYDIVEGVAILPLFGPLFPKANLFTMYSGATSYEEFGNNFAQALDDREVNAIVIEADSPGGSCLRLSELCSQIFMARDEKKPLIGMIDPMACSAAYAIVSQCDELYISESGMAGSIGTVMKYSNWDRAERNEGNDAVLLASSDVKSFGTPQSLAQYQSLIDTLLAYFEQFKDIVARGRQGIDIAAVSGAKVWVGKDAVKMKLVDGVSSMGQIIARLTEK